MTAGWTSMMARIKSEAKTDCDEELLDEGQIGSPTSSTTSSALSSPSAEENLNSSSFVKCGWLTKQGGKGIQKNWRRRFFILTRDRMLYYYRSEKDKIPTGSLNLSLCTDLERLKKPFHWKILSPVRELHLKNESETDMSEWCLALQPYIQFKGFDDEGKKLFHATKERVKAPSRRRLPSQAQYTDDTKSTVCSVTSNDTRINDENPPSTGNKSVYTNEDNDIDKEEEQEHENENEHGLSSSKNIPPSILLRNTAHLRSVQNSTVHKRHSLNQSEMTPTSCLSPPPPPPMMRRSSVSVAPPAPPVPFSFLPQNNKTKQITGKTLLSATLEEEIDNGNIYPLQAKPNISSDLNLPVSDNKKLVAPMNSPRAPPLAPKPKIQSPIIGVKMKPAIAVKPTNSSPNLITEKFNEAISTDTPIDSNKVTQCASEKGQNVHSKPKTELNPRLQDEIEVESLSSPTHSRNNVCTEHNDSLSHRNSLNDKNDINQIQNNTASYKLKKSSSLRVNGQTFSSKILPPPPPPPPPPSSSPSNSLITGSTGISVENQTPMTSGSSSMEPSCDLTPKLEQSPKSRQMESEWSMINAEKKQIERQQEELKEAWNVVRFEREKCAKVMNERAES